jgi:hypothetical protein
MSTVNGFVGFVDQLAKIVIMGAVPAAASRTVF